MWDVQKARLAQDAQDTELQSVFASLAFAMAPQRSASSSARAPAGQDCLSLSLTILVAALILTSFWCCKQTAGSD